MGIFNLFKKNDNSASQAKERLQIIIAHQRDGRSGHAEETLPFMEEMKMEILEVVKKYVNISPTDIDANISKRGDSETLELNINLNEEEKDSNKSPD